MMAVRLVSPPWHRYFSRAAPVFFWRPPLALGDAMIILGPLLTVLNIAIDLYIWAIIISAILSWLVQFGIVNTGNQFVSMVGEFLWRITNPALRHIRRVVPAMGGIDLSPVALILLLIFVQMVIRNVHMSMMSASF